MSDLRELNRAVQRAEFPSHGFAKAVREALAEITERMEPAQPEPAAPVEMPDAVDTACDLLEWGGNVNAAAALRAAWRDHSRTVGITEELDAVLDYLQEQCDLIHGDEDAGPMTPAEAHHALSCIAAVRSQYANAQPRPKLPKVREALSLLIWKIDNGEQNRSIGHYAGMLTLALAELDAVEGRGES